MTRVTVGQWGQVLLLALTSGLVARLLTTGRVHLFVGGLVTLLLWCSLPVLVVLTVVGALRVVRGRPGQPASRAAAFVVLPLAVGLAVPLRPLGLLGSVTASRPPARARAPQPSGPASPSAVRIDTATGRTVGGYDNGGDDAGDGRNGPMGPPSGHYRALHGDPAELDLYDYIERVNDPVGTRSLTGRRISILGFASADPANPSGQWVLARLKMWCCVADALPFMVTMDGSVPRPAGGTWVRVIGRYLPVAANGDARFHVDRVVPVAAPKDPYL